VTTIQVPLPFDLLLHNLAQLSNQELAQLAQDAIRLQAQRRAPSLSKAETELLLQISRQLIPADVLQRCRALTIKQRTQGVTAEEQAELVLLVDRIEEVNAARLTALIELASLRQIPLEMLMDQLEIRPFTYD
jgi:hypothetical protein